MTEPYWFNFWFPPLDGLSLAGVLKLRNPKLYLEVGSGNSTKFARKAVKEHTLGTRIVSIDPSPRAEIDAICDEVIRRPLENTEISVFNRLQSGDVLLIDSSHRSFMNSDVTVFFTEILPGLPPGVIYGIHDIFLPNDYPATWTDRYYNEQYLLTMYLLGGAAGDRVLFPASYIAHSGLYAEQLLTLGKKIGLDPTEVRGDVSGCSAEIRRLTGIMGSLERRTGCHEYFRRRRNECFTCAIRSMRVPVHNQSDSGLPTRQAIVPIFNPLSLYVRFPLVVA